MKQIQNYRRKKQRRIEKCYVTALFFVIFVFFVTIPRKEGCLRSNSSPFSHTNLNVDVVYTFVNGSDSSWNILKQFYEHEQENSVNSDVFNGSNSNAFGKNRFRSNNELLYSLRSIDKFAPWVNNVYLVVATLSQVPRWINTEHPRINVVFHEQIFEDPAHLPTFNSAAIESNLDRIPGLAEHYIYFNDDIFLGKPTNLEDFIVDGKQKVYLAWMGPKCAEGCFEEDIGNNICNVACNVSSCNFDLGDCEGTGLFLEESFDIMGKSIEKQKNDCSRKGCFTSWLGDSMCDAVCNNRACAYDGGDCEFSLSNLSIGYIDKNIVVSPFPFLVVDLKNLTSEDLPNMPPIYFARVFSEDNESYIVLLLNVTDIKEGQELNLTLSNKQYTESLSYDVRIVFNASIKAMDLQQNGSIENGDWFYFEASDDESDSPKKFDTFVSSVLHTKYLFREKFPEYSPFDRVIAHTPHLMQKSVVRRMKSTFSDAFKKTSSNKFRAPKDMQFALSYFNFLASEGSNLINLREVFDTFDTDRSGDLSFNELKSLLIANGEYDLGSIKDEGVQEKLEDFARALLSENENFLVKYFNNELELLGSDLGIREMSRMSTGITLKVFFSEYFKKQVLPNVASFLNLEVENIIFVYDGDISFNMMTNTELNFEVYKLDNLRIDTPKFVCINDDVVDSDSQDSNAQAIFDEWEEFYHFLFPNPSQFEVVYKETTFLNNLNLFGGGLVFLLCILFVLRELKNHSHIYRLKLPEKVV